MTLTISVFKRQDWFNFFKCSLKDNVWKLAFWTLAHALCNLNIACIIRVEATSKIEESTSSMNLSNRLKHFDYLIAYYNEVIRFVTSSLIARKVVIDTYINGKLLRAEVQIMLLYRQLLMNETVFELDADHLNSSRFLKNKTLSRSANFKSFDSRRSLCSERLLTKKKIVIFTALVILQFKIESTNKNAHFLHMMFEKSILNSVKSVKKDDLILNVRSLAFWAHSLSTDMNLLMNMLYERKNWTVIQLARTWF